MVPLPIFTCVNGYARVNMFIYYQKTGGAKRGFVQKDVALTKTKFDKNKKTGHFSCPVFLLVEIGGFEPLTSALRTQRSPS